MLNQSPYTLSTQNQTVALAVIQETLDVTSWDEVNQYFRVRFYMATDLNESSSITKVPIQAVLCRDFYAEEIA